MFGLETLLAIRRPPIHACTALRFEADFQESRRSKEAQLKALNDTIARKQNDIASLEAGKQEVESAVSRPPSALGHNPQGFWPIPGTKNHKNHSLLPNCNFSKITEHRGNHGFGFVDPRRFPICCTAYTSPVCTSVNHNNVFPCCAACSFPVCSVVPHFLHHSLHLMGKAKTRTL